MGSRHGRAIFSVLLLQVCVFLGGGEVNRESCWRGQLVLLLEEGIHTGRRQGRGGILCRRWFWSAGLSHCAFDCRGPLATCQHLYSVPLTHPPFPLSSPSPSLHQDLAVVVLLMLIPLLAPSPDGSSTSSAAIAAALGTAAVKAVVCIFAIIAGGRLFIQPLYKKMSQVRV